MGDVFGSALAAEGIFAFFLESGFLAVLLFGWDRVGRKVHFLATCMVCLGAHFSAIWIVVANSWMQTPAGFHIVGEGLKARAEITDFWQMVFNPSVHGPAAARAVRGVAGGGVPGGERERVVSAEEAARGVRAGLAAGRAGRSAWRPRCCNWSAATAARVGVAKNQPAKLAAFEGLYDTTPHAPLTLFGWVDEKGGSGQVGVGDSRPAELSGVTTMPRKPVTGLTRVQAGRPPAGEAVVPVLSHHGGGRLRR